MTYVKLFSAILDLLFPPRCCFCGRLLWEKDGDGRYACRACEEELPYAGKDDGLTLGNCFVWCRSPFLYRGIVRSAVLRLKFGRAEALAGPMGHYVAACLKQYGKTDFSVVTWAPLSRKRRARRGFDQAEAIARRTAAELGLPVEGLLVKQKDTPAQSTTRSRSDRAANVRGAYRIRQKGAAAQRTVLLIDDVVTTGATLSECAETLLRDGAELVYAATFARTEAT